VRGALPSVDVAQLQTILAREWRLADSELDYLPVGGGAYHWAATSPAGRRFITVDDLDTKPWLGTDRDSAFAGLLGAYRTAHELWCGPARSVVVAPEPAGSGDCAYRICDRYSVAVFPFVAGEPGEWGDTVERAEKERLVSLLARLHAIAPASARRHRLEVADRPRFEQLLTELDRPWNSGPFADAARQELADHSGLIADWFGRFDELAAQLGPFEPVITHGEPHPGNLLRTADGIRLVDWDTVAVDRPERDLWMLEDGSGHATSVYEKLTGRVVDPNAITIYRLAWKLADLVAFTVQLYAPHDADPDTEKALWAVRTILAAQEPSPYGQDSTDTP
jgi:spectinomycin phosphotransferase